MTAIDATAAAAIRRVMPIAPDVRVFQTFEWSAGSWLDAGPCASLSRTMASPQTQTTPQRLAAIREQMSLLSDYL
jgi:hypothetical protein